VGRTGAFIVLDSMLERMKKEDNLNIFEFLKQLRAQRVLMVQTQV
jgi:netrin-G3 ligand